MRVTDGFAEEGMAEQVLKGELEFPRQTCGRVGKGVSGTGNVSAKAHTRNCTVFSVSQK